MTEHIKKVLIIVIIIIRDCACAVGKKRQHDGFTRKVVIVCSVSETMLVFVAYL